MEIEVKDGGIIVKPAKPVAQKYFGVFKVEKWPEDLDELIVRAIMDWWSRKGM